MHLEPRAGRRVSREYEGEVRGHSFEVGVGVRAQAEEEDGEEQREEREREGGGAGDRGQGKGQGGEEEWAYVGARGGDRLSTARSLALLALLQWGAASDDR